MSHKCQLCEAVNDATRLGGPAFLGNTILAASRRFLLLPSIGPLVKGHLLVVSREHHFSLASMGAEAIAEYNQFVHETIQNPQGWLEAEHGATEADCAGSCVVHAHVHLIPTKAEFLEVLNGVYQELYRGRSIKLPSEPIPYIYLRASLSEVRVMDGNGLPSQLIRQAICSAEGRSDWDWKDAPRDHLLEETLDFWREIS